MDLIAVILVGISSLRCNLRPKGRLRALGFMTQSGGLVRECLQLRALLERDSV